MSRLPPGTVVYAIGDIHGRCDLLETMQQAIRIDIRLRPAQRRVVVLRFFRALQVSHDEGGYRFVHGHSIVAVPEVRHNRIGIDTGAYKSGALTCLVLDGTGHSFLRT